MSCARALRNCARVWRGRCSVARVGGDHMYKLLRIALFAAPFVGGAAWAQGSGTSGSAGAPGTSATPPSVTDDTRTPLQQKAGRIDDTTPTLPGDATKPMQVPNTVEESNVPALPDHKM